MKPPIVDRSELRLVQQALEEQGYLILAFVVPKDPGTIVPYFHVGTGEHRRHVPGPLVVIGSATEEEWYAQRRKYYPTATGVLSPGLSFSKVVAE